MIEPNVFYLKNRLEAMAGRSYSISEISEGTGLHRNTLRHLINRNVQRIDLDTLAVLLKYFREEGLDITAGDLLREAKEPYKID